MAWSPVRSTVFAATTSGGSIEIWDMATSVVQPFVKLPEADRNERALCLAFCHVSIRSYLRAHHVHSTAGVPAARVVPGCHKCLLAQGHGCSPAWGLDMLRRHACALAADRPSAEHGGWVDRCVTGCCVAAMLMLHDALYLPRRMLAIAYYDSPTVLIDSHAD